MTFLTTIIVASIAFALRDAYLIELRKKPINHKKGFLLRLFVCSVICLIVQKTPHEMVLNFLTAPGIVWFLFQYTLNFLRDKPLFYISDSNLTDRILLKIFKKRNVVFVVLALLFVSSILIRVYGI